MVTKKTYPDAASKAMSGSPEIQIPLGPTARVP